MRPICLDTSDAEGSLNTANFYAINLSKRDAIEIGNIISASKKGMTKWNLLWEALFECEAGNAQFILIRVGDWR